MKSCLPVVCCAFVITLLAGGLSGCILVPAIDSMSELGVRRSDRERLLAQDVKKFNEALYWGSPLEALKFAADDARVDIQNHIAARRSDERIVENKIHAVKFLDDGAYEADVEVLVKYYRVPFYTVQERNEKQSWEFSLAGGWKLKAWQTSKT